MDYKIKLKNIFESCVLTKVPKDSKSFIIHEIVRNFIAHSKKNDFLIVAENDAEIEALEQQIKFFLPEINLLKFYAWDCLPYDRSSPRSFILNDRIKTLHHLANKKTEEKYLVITSINAILQKTIPVNQIKNIALSLEVGSKISIDEIAKFLVLRGYSKEVCANCASQFAVRGGIIDIVIQQQIDPIGYRIDFFGDEIESIKTFDPITQISEDSVKKIEILPASEVLLNKESVDIFRKKYRENFGIPSDNDLFYQAISDSRNYIGMEHWLPLFYKENLVSFFSYLNSPVIFFDDKMPQLGKLRIELINESYLARSEDLKIKKQENIYQPIDKNLLYFTQDELEEVLAKEITIEMNSFEQQDYNKRLIDLEIKPVPDFALVGRTNKEDPIEVMQKFISNLPNYHQKKILFVAITENFKERISKIFIDYNLSSREVENSNQLKDLKLGTIGVAKFICDFGFYSSDFVLIGEQAIFGEKISRKRTNKNASQRIIEEGLSINLNELVVHRDHGIGKFAGIQTISAGSIKCDMIKIIYGGNDVLFVPVDDINLITRYGAENSLIQLDRLGIASWKNRKEKTKKKIRLAAEELIKIAAERKIKQSPKIIPQQELYQEFVANFGFIETEDQLKAIEEVEEDFRKGFPMDRLICGDVGFGKTEVAMRAAGMVVFDDSSEKKQVAIIAPTTLLCRQHFKNFTKRFANSQIKIAQLSRLVSNSETKKNKEEMEKGEVDIVIGTHALLQKNIKFKNLALVIVDEEQHFGVLQKEQLKKLRNNVHVLALSATPIPRTLQMSLTGVKDLSLISSPPLDRLAVRNFVMPYDSVIVREAVMREYNRGGRIFFVVPKIRDIDEIEKRLKILLPEIKITHAHGQMLPKELDTIMNDFVDGKIDLLLSTTIIESGIDIAEANTMIIYKAESFGLAQLYQLRGRVGRTKTRGYAYFMLDERKKISPESRKKLEVMQNLDSLGVGFTVASYDMDIRGSGNLLSDEQSGHIKETGVELYQQLLLEEIEKLKNQQDQKNENQIIDYDFSVLIKIGISLFIPENYISELSLRISFYKKIANLSSAEESQSLINQMEDRFGKVPSEVINLTKISLLKKECKNLKIEKLEANNEGILISFKDNKFSNPEKLLNLIFASKGQIKLSSGQKVLFICSLTNEDEKIKSAFLIINKLKSL